MSNFERIVIEEEAAVIENIEISESLQDKVKKRSDTLIYRRLLNKSLANLKSELPDEEEIEEYLVGRNFKSDSLRVAAAGIGTIGVPGNFLAHPINDWYAKSVLVKTNKRLIVMETAEYFKYLKYYEVENLVKVYVDKDEVYLELFDLRKKQKVIQFAYANKEFIVEKLKDIDINIIEEKGKLKCGERKVFNIILILTWIGAIWALIYSFIAYYQRL